MPRASTRIVGGVTSGADALIAAYGIRRKAIVFAFLAVGCGGKVEESEDAPPHVDAGCATESPDDACRLEACRPAMVSSCEGNPFQPATPKPLRARECDEDAECRAGARCVKVDVQLCCPGSTNDIAPSRMCWPP